MIPPAATQDAAAGENPRKKPVREALGNLSLGISTLSALCVAALITNQPRYPHPSGPGR